MTTIDGFIYKISSTDNKMNYYGYTTKDIKTRLNQNKNVINHSGVCFSKKFWKSYDSELNLLRYRNDKPYEDMSLWTRTVNAGHQIGIINKNLISLVPN